MVWVSPRKRTSTTGIKVFSSYETLSKEGLFVLQRRKLNASREAERAPYRVILKVDELSDYPYYEIANCDDLETIKAREWAYILTEIPRKLPVEWDRKKRKLWLTAHFQQLALEHKKPRGKIASILFTNPPTSSSAMEAPSSDEAEASSEDEQGEEKSDNTLRRRPVRKKTTRRSRSEIPTGLSKARNGYETNLTEIQLFNRKKKAPSAEANWSKAKLVEHYHPSGPMVVTAYVVFSGWKPYAAMFLLVNLFVYLVRDAEIYRFSALVVVLNIFLWRVLIQEDLKISFEAMVERNPEVDMASLTSANTSKTGESLFPSEASSGAEGQGAEDQPGYRKNDELKTLKETSQIRQEQEEIHISQLVAGQSVPRVEAGLGEHPNHSWCATEHGCFQVRHPPNYKRNKIKKESLSAMYQVVAVDLYHTGKKLTHIASKVKSMPGPRFNTNRDTWPNEQLSRAKDDVCPLNYCNDVPYLFIVNFMVPAYTASIWGSESDGEGFNYVLYSCLTPEAREEIEGQECAATRLLKKFVSMHHDCKDPLHGRFKCIPQITNADDLGLDRVWQQFINTYNSKPFLTGPKYHTVIEGPGYIEIDVDIHRFCYAARRASASLIGHVPLAVFNMGFVVQGVGDDEQPERLLCCCKVHNIDPTKCTHVSH